MWHAQHVPRWTSSYSRTAAAQTLALLGAGVGTSAAAASAYLGILAIAALSAERSRHVPMARGRSQLIVLIPAHNEAELLGRCLRTMIAQDYPQDRYRVVVIADNCTDSTAEVAAALGVDVLVRDDPAARGKGHALRWAMDELIRSGGQFDAFVVVDADSDVDPALLTGLAARHEAGAEAVQANYAAIAEDGTRGELRAAAFLLFHGARFRGRAALGLPCSLVGNGMLLGRELVSHHPWTAFSPAEDLARGGPRVYPDEFTLTLRLAGVEPAFSADARLRAPVAAGGTAADTQRRRWEGGRLQLVRSWLPQLARACSLQRRWRLWDAAVDLAVPPLGVLTVGVLGGSALQLGLWATGGAGGWTLVPWGIAVIALPTYVLLGLRAAGAPTSTYVALLRAPAAVVRDLRVRARVLRQLKELSWERTARPGELAKALPRAGRRC